MPCSTVLVRRTAEWLCTYVWLEASLHCPVVILRFDLLRPRLFPPRPAAPPLLRCSALFYLHCS
eukprot:COSAG01_NODE_46400_length_400_cov_1.574751_1_plen_63_part_01